nr:tetratricopeptide repeat protein [Streptomyces sp. SBE_14.2]
MSRLSRAQNPVQQAGSSAAPIQVHVPAAGQGGASVGGVTVTAAPGQEIQQAVLNHLHRIALAGGHPVHATIRDDRIGYAVPLQINLDGSSTLTGQPWEVTTEPTPVASEPAPLAPTPPLCVVDPHPIPLGTVSPPTGVFGPPPVMAPQPTPAADTPPPTPQPGPKPKPHPFLQATALPPEPAPKTPTRARGFDAVAEAVLGDEPSPAGPLAEPVAAINEAVREGRTEDAARLAEHAVAEASRALGPEHPEVLRLRELAAYIAYLAGEPATAFALALEVAGIHHRAHDREAAYGNVLSAATAWRAVRDPELGLRLGDELIALWSALAEDGGPAAEEPGRLESARTRMNRLTERAARL